MTRLRPCVLPLLILCALVATGCDDDLPTDPGPAPVEITEPPFTGTLEINGARTVPFSATSFGTVRVTLQALDPNPDNSVRVGLALGTWNGTSCQLLITNDAAAVGAIVIGSVTSAGNLCVRIFDAGDLTEEVTFDVRIVHP